VALLLASPPALAAPDPTALYAEHCASCHGTDRLGGIGPALLPENLGRLKPDQAAEIIARGRAATQMPAFADRLTPAEIETLAALVQTPLPEIPRWGEAEIAASRQIIVPTDELVARPAYDADPLNLFVVVESGDHHVTILDGDRFEPLVRFPSRFALHGGPKLSPDGRFVHLASRDGWVTRYDLWGLQTVAEVRAGINTRNIAISADGKVIAVANYLPHTLVMLDAATLAPLKVIPVEDAGGKRTSRVSAVYQAAPRQSFIAALKDIPEIWEVSWLEDPPKVFAGLVHSYEPGMVEGLAQAGRFPIRRIEELDEPLDDFFFDPDYRNLIGSSRDGGRGIVVNLDVRRVIAELPLPGLPHLGSGISWERQGRRVMATPHLKEPAISVIDMQSWQLVKRIETLGPGFFLRGHEASPYVWADVFSGPHRDALHVIDKETLEIVRTVRPEPGRTAGHVEFTRDGRYALVSVWEMDGAVVVYDARTLQPVRRIPMRKPVGKYNVWNKIQRSEGTSH
jgi:DNA-binding beta-propeller fold protein YncE